MYILFSILTAVGFTADSNTFYKCIVNWKYHYIWLFLGKNTKHICTILYFPHWLCRKIFDGI